MIPPIPRGALVTIRKQHLVHLLVRRVDAGEQRYFVYPLQEEKSLNGPEHLTLPAKRTVHDPLASFIRGTSIDSFVDMIVHEELSLNDDQYVLEQELPPITLQAESPVHQELTEYSVYPVDVWVESTAAASLDKRLGGRWLSCSEGVASEQLWPTSKAVLQMIQDKGTSIFVRSTEHPTMDGLALKWFHKNQDGIRLLSKNTLDQVLDAGNRAFNLRVADPYLRYQLQGLGFTWSFFTEKDRQDTHVHGAPVVEVYGVLEGRLEIWSKPYYNRGTSAWSHSILNAGDWIEVDSLQCHIVHWLTKGKGVVFKAGPGPLTGVGRLGEKGKTPCSDCTCMKPSEVLRLEQLLGSGH
jgi:hypothetical protein